MWLSGAIFLTLLENELLFFTQNNSVYERHAKRISCLSHPVSRPPAMGL
jgi:hypothetical protein